MPNVNEFENYTCIYRDDSSINSRPTCIVVHAARVSLDNRANAACTSIKVHCVLNTCYTFVKYF